MIISGILYAIFGVVWVILAPLRLLPEVSMPSGITNAIVAISGYLAALYAMAPITTAALVAIIGLVLTVEAAILVYKGIMWVIRKIPGVN